jgi:DNA-binding response OmpR family regulator
LVLLDLSLPDGDGLEFLKDIRQKGFTIPVVILTARTDEETVVRGLRLGANDYVRKPFGNKELLARVEAALRGPNAGGSRLAYDRLVVQVDRRKAFFNGVDMDLKRREFDLLQHLVEHADAVVTRESLLDRFDADGEIFDRTVDSHVSHLRTKLRQAGADTIRITSVYGIGYRLEME